jgi:hypothetical protein
MSCPFLVLAQVEFAFEIKQSRSQSPSRFNGKIAFMRDGADDLDA